MGGAMTMVAPPFLILREVGSVVPSRPLCGSVSAGSEAAWVAACTSFGTGRHFWPAPISNLSAYLVFPAIIVGMSDDKQRILMATSVMIAILVIMSLSIARLWIVP